MCEYTIKVKGYVKTDQINCLFHRSNGSVFLALKKYINWIGMALPAPRQWHLGIVTVIALHGSS